MKNYYIQNDTSFEQTQTCNQCLSLITYQYEKDRRFNFSLEIHTNFENNKISTKLTGLFLLLYTYW